MVNYDTAKCMAEWERRGKNISAAARALGMPPTSLSAIVRKAGGCGHGKRWKGEGAPDSPDALPAASPSAEPDTAGLKTVTVAALGSALSDAQMVLKALRAMGPGCVVHEHDLAAHFGLGESRLRRVKNDAEIVEKHRHIVHARNGVRGGWYFGSKAAIAALKQETS